MNQILKHFENLIARYKLNNDIPVFVQNNILKGRKGSLIKVLKHHNDYSFIFGKVLSVYFIGKKFGKTLSFTTCKIILGITISIMATITMATGYYILDKLHTKPLDTIDKKGINKKKNILEKKQKKKTLRTITISSIGFEPLTGEDKNKEYSNQLLQALQSKTTIVSLGNRNRNQAKKILTGSVRTIFNKEMLVIKIIDTKTGKIEYMQNITIKDNKIPDDSLRQIILHIKKTR